MASLLSDVLGICSLYDSVDRQDGCSQRQHGIDETDLPVTGQVGDKNITLLEQTAVKQTLPHGAAKERSSGCKPLFTVAECDVGIRSIGKVIVTNDKYFVTVALPFFSLSSAERSAHL